MTCTARGALFLCALLCLIPLAEAASTMVPGLDERVRVTRDIDGIVHVRAANEHDMFFMQGWFHAQDRLYQMDENRRTASGTLAELLGQGALASDIELRTIGLRRSADRSWIAIQKSAMEGDPVSRRTVAAIKAYARGVNAYVAQAGFLPPEYGALGLDRFEPWTEVDSIVIGKLIAFGLSFDLDDISNTIALQTYQELAQALAGSPLAFDPLALFSEDLYRSEPFDPAATVPDSGGDGPRVKPGPRNFSARAASPALPSLAVPAALGRQYLERIRNVPLLQRAPGREFSDRGSNHWGVSAARSASGNPIIANDPHLSLNHPSTFYPMHLRAPGYDAVGNGFAGAPFIITGQNRSYAWGPTTNPLDVTDVFLDTLVPDPDAPIGLSVLLPGNVLAPVVPIPEAFRYNQFDGTLGVVAGATLTVPARYHGVIVNFDPAAGQALTVQFTGFGPTRELETFYIWNKGRDLEDFRTGLERFDFGSQNWAYADRKGNLAYFTSAEMPVRVDLETLGGPALGIPPWLIRIGADPRHQWLGKSNHYPGQTTPYEILSPDEMPQVLNPRNGFFVNANNDPTGFTNDNNPLNQLRDSGGIFYLSPGYASGFRAGRITRRLQREFASGDGKVSVEEMAAIQADVGLLDAEFFAPLIVQAYDAAGEDGADPALAAAAADPRLAEAVMRLRNWGMLDYQARTGIPEGHDEADPAGMPAASLNQDEITASVATTIYSVWRSSFIAATIDATLDAFPIPDVPRPGSSLAMTALKKLVERGGNSASGLDFFAGGAADQATDVQVVMLAGLSDALDRLAGPEFDAVFGGSADQADYRWGLLHRIEFDSNLGQPFSVPQAFGAYPAPIPGLRGIPTDGGFGTVDASSHNARARGPDGFMFGSGPTNRWVSEVARKGPRSQSVWPGGTSAVPGDPFYIFPMLPRWLTNDAETIRFKPVEIRSGAAEMMVFDPE